MNEKSTLIPNIYTHCDMMVMLSRMRREMDMLFPEARAFQRPGLD